MNTAHYESWLLSDSPEMRSVAQRLIAFVRDGCKKEKSATVKKPLLDPRVVKYNREHGILTAEHCKGHVTANGLVNINPSEERSEHDEIDEVVVETEVVHEQKTAAQMIAEVKAEDNTQPCETGTVEISKPVPAFISQIPPKLAGKVFTVDKDWQGGVKKTITPEALRERMKIFIPK